LPLLIDVHTIDDGVSAGNGAGAQQKDLETKGAYGMDDKRYRVDDEAGKISCLVEADCAEDAVRAHREAHGLVGREITGVGQHS
jgi:hypothetical protein